MKHSLFERCDCAKCEGERFESRIVTIMVIALVAVGVVLWTIRSLG